MKGIKYWRKIEELTQAQLAEKVGVSRQTVAAWESGERDIPSSQLINISKALDVRIDILIDPGDDTEIEKVENKEESDEPKQELLEEFYLLYHQWDGDEYSDPCWVCSGQYRTLKLLMEARARLMTFDFKEFKVTKTCKYRISLKGGK